jgi:ADP-ribose pyrophosphatase
MTDEMVSIFYATGLTKMTEGGGVGGENIKVHYVHHSDVTKWCRDRQAEGMRVDFKIFAAIQLARAVSQSTGSKLWY